MNPHVSPRIIQAVIIAKALELYAKGIRVNRAYTPRRMIDQAAVITGLRFSPHDYLGAAQALRQWAEEASQ